MTRRSRGHDAKAHRILSCGVVVLREAEDGYRYLLLRAYNYWDFPKGAVEPGETPLDAAIREVREETTLEDLRFTWGEVYQETPPYNHGRKVARYYVAETRSDRVALPVSPDLGHPEHSEYRWVDRSEAMRMVTPRVRAIIEWCGAVVGGSPEP